MDSSLAPTYTRKPISLDTLPFDVLHEIYLWFGLQAHIPRSYRLINTLGYVNRQLRVFALPFILREISVSSLKLLSRVLCFFVKLLGQS